MSIEEVSKYVFFVSLGLLLYTYVGYALLAALLGSLRKRKVYPLEEDYSTSVSVIIPAYNEKGILPAKLQNTFDALKNFKNSQVILITDGSNDGSAEMDLSRFHVLHLHSNERKGKSAAINKSMEKATGEIIIITDANAMVNQKAFEKLVIRFKNLHIGAVSGEKKVLTKEGSIGGEGLYWKYESFLKKNSARMYTLTGAAGELLALRKELFRPIPEDAILDDLELSLDIINQGKIIDYEPEAFAIEPPSKSINDEFMRKVRISAGVFQTLKRNLFVFNPFKHAIFIFQFNSHRVLRWTIGLICITLLFLSNLMLLLKLTNEIYFVFFASFFILQSLFYLFVLLGFIFRNHKKIPSFLFLPFYFIMMNVAVLVGYFRYLGGKETVLWKKANR
jgi:cellulose synthase/poly-beta-1,6-N-acetylglucosamine synthase-like glycosyltransferase